MQLSEVHEEGRVNKYFNIKYTRRSKCQMQMSDKDKTQTFWDMFTVEN